jgi:PAS domain S-box-containing protein
MAADPDTVSVPPADGRLTPTEAEAILARLAGELSTAAAPPPPREPPARPKPGHSHDLATDRSHAAPTVSADTLRHMLEALPDALVVVDHEGRIVLVNAQTEELFGYRRQDLLGHAIEILVPERLRERHVEQRAAYAVAPRVRPMGQGLELFGRRKDGREIPVEISLSPFRTEAGLLVVSTVRDVSERRRSEAQLRKMEARYRTLVESIPAVTFMAALDGTAKELYVSPQVEELLGFSQQEWLDNPVLWYTQLHPEDRVRWHDEFARTCSVGEPFRSVYRFLSRDGRVVWVHGEAKVVRDEDGRPIFLQGVAFDLTPIKEAEGELKALNQTLEQRVAARTEEAEHRASELARSNKALERLGSVMAHDLRQPLRTMKSFIQKLAERYEGKLDAQADDYISRSVRAAERMGGLIDDLLAYSRVRTQGKAPAPTDCRGALDEACANLGAAIDESGAAVTADELPTVLADRTQLVQLFQNLAGNALKFRDAARPSRVQVSARRRGELWEIAVADNGIGFDPQYRERIFGLGERLHSIKQFPGNGIGLATCQEIVQRHGGTIWAESAGEGHGSTFRFTLPAVPA